MTFRGLELWVIHDELLILLFVGLFAEGGTERVGSVFQRRVAFMDFTSAVFTVSVHGGSKGLSSNYNTFLCKLEWQSLHNQTISNGLE